MKILKIILVTILILFLGIISFGIFNPSINYETKINLNISLEESFAAFNDIELVNQLIPGFISSDIISGNPNEMGAKYKLIIRFKGENYIMTETIKALWKNALVVYNFENEIFSFSTTMRFIKASESYGVRDEKTNDFDTKFDQTNSIDKLSPSNSEDKLDLTNSDTETDQRLARMEKDFKPDALGTEIRIENNLIGKNVFWKSGFQLCKSIINEGYDKVYRLLKSKMERME